MPDTYTLTVTADEVNAIGAGLGKLPYENVAQLLGKLVQQVQEQNIPADRRDKTPEESAVIGAPVKRKGGRPRKNGRPSKPGPAWEWSDAADAWVATADKPNGSATEQP
jgi:hypothetical protein